MIVRSARKSDVKQLVKLDREAKREIKWWTPYKAKDFLKVMRKNNSLFVAEDKSIIAGYISGRIIKKMLVLDNVFVLKKYRQKHIAMKLINKFISVWKSSRPKEIRLFCPERLRKFYEKMGFEVTSLEMKRKFKLL